MTSPTQHSLQIMTLATWLCVGVAAVAGLVIKAERAEFDIAVGETQGLVNADILVVPSSGSAGQAVDGSEVTSAADSWLSEPPPMPEVVRMDPLPEIPEMRRPLASSSHSAASITPSAPQTREVSDRPPVTRPRTDALSGGGGSGGEVAMASRMAAGQMPAPSYPFDAKRRGQSGTVLVEFTVGESGRVTAAILKKPSPWPLLNQEALRAVRRWKFPPGDVMKVQRPIVFQLR